MALPAVANTKVDIRDVQKSDINALTQLEQTCFATDRLSKRQFSYWLKAQHRVFLVAESNGSLLGYGLVIMRKGTRLARLYSIAVSPDARGLGLGKQLIEALEQTTLSFDKLFMRLEVAENNEAAISLYKSMGYKVFGTYTHYYEDNSNALRMQKDIRQQFVARKLSPYPWYQQTTEFTCGPSSLMMALGKLDKQFVLSQRLELDLWREATTIFMMAGHGGCHPIGLALAAHKRGYKSEVFINQALPLFTGGVRSTHKKEIIEHVELHFEEQATAEGITIKNEEFTLEHLKAALSSGKAVLTMISTYQLDGHKVPHWIAVTAIDDTCLYIHDPCVDDLHSAPLDCQHIPIALDDFYKLSSYGKTKLRTAVLLSLQ
ncbi:GNAT family N-acetyltransferase/peptidase C39 family protein [Aestuariibacter sp. AA17]|uniref:GNAT family N-acetyltransferase/peptidase C39 family protein n=1 Tax=Fluctibacter corallii TaxID=2984329 RepID=A0ABT3AA70_9ALTE|nr:GNAT family N-acetyltransferase/peptidase C39 family protein [Aestuariibacter sp. AA17]MCV2885523.1 GNAT family N-acetyltransferase/peptidase C39 family protein [Aestuariibacter sp. AA17]